ncbi:MAG TPA: KH domain-containing protein, partial [Candidatus Omnitrophota bacterium]|nr:KH domain-containing protein [Candidatus Omnitrophota bacterium]
LSGLLNPLIGFLRDSGIGLHRIIDIGIHPGIRLYQITDREDHFIIQEMIREKILSHTYEEIPHSVAVMVDELKFDDKDDSMEVYATIYVERTSQKGILIGHNGEMLKEIKSRAKAAISKYFNKTVNLDLWVKVRDKWKKNPSALQDMGYADEV